MQRKIILPEFDSAPIASTGRFWAVVSLILWAGAIFAGRLLAYTCTWMMVDSKC